MFNGFGGLFCFMAKKHPRDMGAPEVEAFLTHLAVEGSVSASTQNQALAALCFYINHRSGK